MPREALLERCVAEARVQYPGIQVSASDLHAALSRQLAEVDLAECQYPADVCVAAAASLGDPAATTIVHDRLAHFARLATRGLLPPAELDELVQQVAIRLLTGEAPQIRRYTGLGPLDAWLRAVILRAALSARRSSRSKIPDASLDEMSWLELPIAMEQPSALGGDRVRASHYRAAFEQAIASLGARQRTLLRQHFLDGVSSEQLGRMYNVHRVTVYRWIAEAKQHVISHVREKLAEVAGTPSEVESLMRGIRSGFSVTIERLLADDS